jgi:hypothetical protein
MSEKSRIWDEHCYPNFQSHNDAYRDTINIEESFLLLMANYDSLVDMSSFDISWKEGDRLIEDAFPDPPESSSILEDYFASGTTAAPQKTVATDTALMPNVKSASDNSSAPESPISAKITSSCGRLNPLPITCPPNRTRHRVSPDTVLDNDCTISASPSSQIGEASPEFAVPNLEDVMNRLQLSDASLGSSTPSDISHPSEYSEVTDSDQRRKRALLPLRKQAILRSAVIGVVQKRESKIFEGPVQSSEVAAQFKRQYELQQQLVEKQKELSKVKTEISQAKKRLLDMPQKRKHDESSQIPPTGPEEAQETTPDAEDGVPPTKRSRIEEGVTIVYNGEADKAEEQASITKTNSESFSEDKHAMEVNASNSKESKAQEMVEETVEMASEQNWHTAVLGASPIIYQPLSNERSSPPHAVLEPAIQRTTPTKNTRDPTKSISPSLLNEGGDTMPAMLTPKPKKSIEHRDPKTPTSDTMKAARKEPVPAAATSDTTPSTTLQQTTPKMTSVTNVQPVDLPARSFYRSKILKELRDIAIERNMGNFFWAKKEKVIDHLMAWDKNHFDASTSNRGGTLVSTDPSESSSPAKEKKSPVPWNKRTAGVFRNESPFSSPSKILLSANNQLDQTKQDNHAVTWENLNVENFTSLNSSPPKKRKILENPPAPMAKDEKEPKDETAEIPSKRRKLSGNRATSRVEEQKPDSDVARKVTRASAADQQIQEMKMTRANVAGLKAEGPRKFVASKSKRRSL